MRVAELFGPTLQGEGPSSGHPAVFVRLSGCNLNCSWCDTPYTWDWKGQNGVAYDREAEKIDMSAYDVAGDIADRAHGDLVVVTGGEPLVQQASVVELCRLLADKAFRIEIETNGTVTPSPLLLDMGAVRFNVSPKLSNSGIDLDRRWKPDVIDCFGKSHKASFKLVVGTPADVDEAVTLLMDRWVRSSDIWLMPEASTPDQLVERIGPIADAAVRWGFHLSSRLHLLAWGAERGR